MHPQLVHSYVDRVRNRVAQGDHPTTPALSVENLEDLVIALTTPPVPNFAEAVARAIAEDQGEPYAEHKSEYDSYGRIAASILAALSGPTTPTGMTDTKTQELVEWLRASGTANAPRNSNGIYMSICDEAAAALERLSAERDEAKEALRPFAAMRPVNISMTQAGWSVLFASGSPQPKFDDFKTARAALKAEPVEP